MPDCAHHHNSSPASGSSCKREAIELTRQHIVSERVQQEMDLYCGSIDTCVTCMINEQAVHVGQTWIQHHIHQARTNSCLKVLIRTAKLKVTGAGYLADHLSAPLFS